MSAKEEEAGPLQRTAVSSAVPSEPKSRRQRLAARLFAPERFSAALAVLWFFVAFIIISVLAVRGDVALAIVGAVSLCLAAPAGIFAVRALRRAYFMRHYARCLRGECPRCRYPLRDLTDSTCPECGCNTSATCEQAARLLGAAEIDGANPPR